MDAWGNYIEQISLELRVNLFYMQKQRTFRIYVRAVPDDAHKEKRGCTGNDL